DNEIIPNRSSFNSGATGTQALYTLLNETGRNVTRWQSPMDALTTQSVKNTPSTFVVVGKTRRQFEDIEIKQLLEWVNNGGRLVLADRNLDERLTKAIAVWQLTQKTNDLELLIMTDPSDAPQMTSGMPASKPVQPSVFTQNVNAIQTSRFASHIEISMKAPDVVQTSGYGSDTANITAQPRSTLYDFYQPTPSPSPTGTTYEMRGDAPPPAPSRSTSLTTVQGDEVAGDAAYSAPVVHVIGNARNVLVDIPYGAGEIVVLSDPFIVSNAGLGLVDNAQLAINVVASGGGLVAFDEFHQGYGANRNQLFAYFSGTPMIAIFGQLALIIFVIMFSRSRRFARAVPEREPDRRTKLEYVGAMAELQQRTRAYDLALENIFADFKRRVSNLFGLDVRLTSSRQLAKLIAERGKVDAAEVESVLEKVQDIIHGEATNKRETVALAGRLREIESQLGMDRTVNRRAVR
ncbi:MAG TPA: DUF4350 domain-containing protein, partial [Pyrinomonadaceae bacterium]|nr:DUF4350 domain-containing protein [Pyrinomonadaceae bacterium]